MLQELGVGHAYIALNIIILMSFGDTKFSDLVRLVGKLMSILRADTQN